jgi:hypothetical protein
MRRGYLATEGYTLPPHPMAMQTQARAAWAVRRFDSGRAYSSSQLPSERVLMVKFSRSADVDGYIASNGYTITRQYAPPNNNADRAAGRHGTTVYGYDVADPIGQHVRSMTTARSAKAVVATDAERIAAAMTDAQRAVIANITAHYSAPNVSIVDRKRVFDFPPTFTIAATVTDDAGNARRWDVTPDGMPTPVHVAA